MATQSGFHRSRSFLVVLESLVESIRGTTYLQFQLRQLQNMGMEQMFGCEIACSKHTTQRGGGGRRTYHATYYQA